MAGEKISQIRKAVEECDEKSVLRQVKEAINEGIMPIQILNEGLAKGMKRVGEKFEKREYFLIHMMVAASAMKKAVKLIMPLLDKKTLKKRKKVVICTVQGDIHTIGKDLVATYLEAEGFDVYDLGADVPSMKVIEAAEKIGADIIALSSLMTTTMSMQKEIIKILEEMKIREKYIVMVGGGSVTAEYAKQIGADGYGKDAIEAVHCVKQLVGIE